jgi:hypothetical protein
LSDKNKGKERGAKWYHWVIAGAIIATMIGIGFTVVPQIVIPSTPTTPSSTSSASLLTTAEADALFEKNWLYLPKTQYSNAWAFNSDFKYFIYPNVAPLVYTWGTQTTNVLNSPEWQKHGLKPGVALVVKNAGKVILCYNWLYSTNGLRLSTAFNYTALFNLSDFNIEKAAGNYTIKYI